MTRVSVRFAEPEDKAERDFSLHTEMPSVPLAGDMMWFLPPGKNGVVGPRPFMVCRVEYQALYLADSVPVGWGVWVYVVPKPSTG